MSSIPVTKLRESHYTTEKALFPLPMSNRPKSRPGVVVMEEAVGEAIVKVEDSGDPKKTELVGRYGSG
jgi:hypothetical protein